MVSGGCIVSGTNIRNSLLFTQVHTNSYATLDHCVVLPYVNVARTARLKNCVIDRGVQIPNGLVVGADPDADAKWFRVSDGGVTLITQTMLTKRDWQRILGVSPRTVARLIAGGELPPGRMVGGMRRWSIAEVEQFLKSSK